MPKYRVSFNGWFIVEADTAEDALEATPYDLEVKYTEYENTEAEEWEK